MSLIKVAAEVVQTTRRVIIRLAAQWPWTSASPAEPWSSYQAVSARAIAHLSTAASSVTPPAAFAPSS